jgi:thiamine-phosphate pyrophosphorylase
MVKPDRLKNRRIPPSPLMLRAGVKQLALMTDQVRLPDPESVMALMPRGSWVIFRDYDAIERARLAACVQKMAKRYHHRFIVAGELALARHLNADGVHLPDYMLYQQQPNLARFAIVTAACHSRQSLVRASMIDVDAAFVSPVFPTGSHLGADALGVHRFARLICGAGCGVVALGGVSQNNAASLSGLGLVAVAGITGLVSDRLLGRTN